MGRPSFDHDPGSDTYSARFRRLNLEERRRIDGKLARLADALFMRPEHAEDLERVYAIKLNVQGGTLGREDVPYLKRLFEEHGIA